MSIKPNNINAVLLFSGLFISQVSSAALVDQWGTGASSSVRTCASFSATCSTSTGPSTFGPYEDNLFSSASTSSATSTLGDGTGTSQIVNTSGINTIRLTGYGQGAAKNPGPGGVGRGSSWGLLGYTYNGPGETLELDINLDGTISNPLNSGFNDISASVFIVDADEWEDNLGGFTTDASGFFGEGIFPIAELYLDLTATGSTDGSIFLGVSPGDSFYIWATMTVGGAAGGFSNSLSSLDMAFIDNSNLIANGTPVPVPAAAWLLLSGLIAVPRIRKSQVFSNQI